jgi:hypothetical protein
MRTVTRFVSGLVIALPFVAFAETPSNKLAHDGFTFVVPKGWTENAHAGEQVRKVVEQIGTGGAAVYMRPEGKGAAIVQWMRSSTQIATYRIAIESAIAALRADREKAGKFKYEVSETRTRITTRFETESPEGVRSYGIMVNAVDREGYLLTWSSGCMFGGEVAKTVEPLCKTAMTTFVTTMKDSELKQIEPKK